MNKDYFTDERMWALSRKRWKLHQWWRRVRIPLAIALIVTAYALAMWFDERDRRMAAESRLQFISWHLVNSGCLLGKQPVSLLVVGDSEDTLTMALAQAAGEADNMRLAWKIAKEQALPK